MRTSLTSSEKGTTLMIAMCTIGVLSLVAAGVLVNTTARYNAAYSSVKGWKEALYAAEAGADAAFAEVRQNGLDSTKGFSSSAWDTTLALPAPQPNDWSFGYSTTHPAITFGSNGNLSARVTVDKFGSLTGNAAAPYYRIRSVGTAQVLGLKRVGMDDAMTSGGTHFGTGTAARGDGDSLLRKIDYNIDHFISTYGFGDALPSTGATTSNGKGSVEVNDPNRPQVSRRVELVAVPLMPIEGAVKTNGGAYNFPYIDSYNSANGIYPGANCAKTGSGCSAQQYADSRNGNVVDGSSSFNGTVYGDVTTNGSNAKTMGTGGSVSGVVDNNVAIAPIPNWPEPAGPFPPATSAPSSLTPPAREIAPTGNNPVDSRQQREFYYHYTSLGNITINPAPALDSTGLNGGVVETTIHIKVDGDVTANTITVGKGVFAKIYFYANVSGKANTYDNSNVEPLAGNGVMVPRTATVTLSSSSTTMTSSNVTFTSSDVGKQVRGVGIPSGTTIASFVNSSTVTLSTTPLYNGTQNNVTLGGYAPSTSTSAADHFWMIGEGTNQSIVLGSGQPQTNYVVWYAPNATFSVNGNPDFVGAFVVKSISGTGNNTLHFDKALLTAGKPLDYRVASYVEDVR